ncbi:MAG TPA: hypothetical protein VKB91_03550 [Gemmatimonadaceae bacterium]|nr:hypothetical protein [Gemmatimonadaceae bacterium]
MKAELLTLRVIHILGGIFWVGSLMYTTFFLVPAIRSLPAVAGPVMAGLQKRRLFTILPVVALLTIFSGIRLLWIASAGFDDSYLSTSTGRAFSVGAGAAIIAFLLSVLVSRPGFLKVVKLSASLATATDEATRQPLLAEMQRINKRAATANAIVVVLLLLTAVLMATARYL